MWTTVVTAVTRFFAAIADVAFKWAGIIGAYLLGRRSQQRADLERTVDVQRDQLEAATRAPATKADLVERARNHDL